jgi:hypothetical protein
MKWHVDRDPLFKTVDLKAGDTRATTLNDGVAAKVKLVSVLENCDTVRGAVRRAEVTVEINGTMVKLASGNYRLPVTIAGVQIDCPVTGGYLKRRERNVWALEGDARLRLWPAGSDWIDPDTFVYPVGQRWFASDTQMCNEPCFVDGVEPADTEGDIYYHNGLDFGAAEGLVDVLSPAEGLVVLREDRKLEGYEEVPAEPCPGRVTVLDRRGWCLGFAHLMTVEPEVQPGSIVQMGQKIGTVGKEGHSGGWSHLHLGITRRMDSGKWGSDDGYAFAWQAYHRQYTPDLIAHARPHHLTWNGDWIMLDGSRSWSRSGEITGYEWTFTDGATASGPKPARSYERGGVYSEILKVTDAAGRSDYDFAVVEVADRDSPDTPAPGIHLAYAPTFNIRPRDTVTFKVRTFGTTHGEELWDFGDGSPALTTQSDGNVDPHAPDGYAVLEHSFKGTGQYIVTVRRTSEHGMEAVARRCVHVV